VESLERPSGSVPLPCSQSPRGSGRLLTSCGPEKRAVEDGAMWQPIRRPPDRSPPGTAERGVPARRAPSACPLTRYTFPAESVGPGKPNRLLLARRREAGDTAAFGWAPLGFKCPAASASGSSACLSTTKIRSITCWSPRAQSTCSPSRRDARFRRWSIIATQRCGLAPPRRSGYRFSASTTIHPTRECHPCSCFEAACGPPWP
jgi:hypothetical protein